MTRYITMLIAAVLALLTVSCVNFDTATGETTVHVQLVKPADFTGNTRLTGHTVTLTTGGQTLSAITDEQGVATFGHIIPDVYNIAVSWSMTGADYAAATASSEAVSTATVSGTMNERLISREETIELPTHASPDRDIVIGKVYYAGSRDNNHRNYIAGKYIELYNQSDHEVDVSGLYVGIVEAESTPAYTLTNLHEAFADSVVLLKQLYRIPAGKPFMVAPGGTVVICNSATDHTVNDSVEHDLSQADFEVADVTGRYQNNPATPKMELIYNIYSGTSIMNLLQGGPAGVVVLRTNEDVSQWATTYKYGKANGLKWLCCPRRLILDGMEALANKSSGIDVSTKRLHDKIDAGYTHIQAASGWSGETVYRKTLKRGGIGQRILVDTNNSSNDFQVSTQIQPREYDE